MHSFATSADVGPGATVRPEAVKRAAHRILARSSLDAPSHFALGLLEQRAGNVRGARARINYATRLNPRFRPALAWLLMDAVRAGDAEAAALAARRVLSLSPSTTPAVSALLADLAKDPKARRAIALRFRNEPMILDIANAAARSGLSTRALLDLLNPTEFKTIPNGVLRAQTIVAERLLREGRYQEARRAWFGLAGLSAQRGVFDKNFAGLEGAPPFGWMLSNGSDVQTTIEARASAANGQLSVTAFSTLLTNVAEQKLTLASGRYWLRSNAQSPDAGADKAFAWTLACDRGKALVEARLRATTGDRFAVRESFTVPADCGLLTLRLVKLRTGGAPRTIRVEDVSIDPV